LSLGSKAELGTIYIFLFELFYRIEICF
jgi:hypothetical protein